MAAAAPRPGPKMAANGLRNVAAPPGPGGTAPARARAGTAAASASCLRSAGPRQGWGTAGWGARDRRAQGRAPLAAARSAPDGTPFNPGGRGEAQQKPPHEGSVRRGSRDSGRGCRCQWRGLTWTRPESAGRQGCSHTQHVNRRRLLPSLSRRGEASGTPFK